MALKLIATYSKRLGLPGYSSHQFSVCVETEITNLDDVAGESARLYQSLQHSVDEEIQHTGFVPDHAYGMNGQSNGQSNGHTNGNGKSRSNGDAWACSDKQRELILNLVEEYQLEKNEVETLSREMFGAGVRELNKLEASGLIDRILDDHGRKPNRATAPRRGFQHGGVR